MRKRTKCDKDQRNCRELPFRKRWTVFNSLHELGLQEACHMDLPVVVCVVAVKVVVIAGEHVSDRVPETGRV